MKLYGTKLFNNSKGETVECIEITTCYPIDSAWEANKKQRQAHADKNNDGKLGETARFFNSTDGRQAWVDTEARVWWLEDPR